MISRYVLWSTVAPQTSGDSALFTPENLESLIPESLEFATRIAIRSVLATIDIGAEVAVEAADEQGPLWMTAYERTPLEELSLSVRSFNCLKSASVVTLEDLLAWTPARLIRLRHFGTRCMQEVTEKLSALGLRTSGVNLPFAGGSPLDKPAKGGYPFACLLAADEVLPDGALRNKLHKRGWQTLGDVAAQTLLEASEAAGLTRTERKTLDTIMANLSLSLPVEQPAWVTAHIGDLRRRFSPELSALGSAIESDVKLPVSIFGILQDSPHSFNDEVERLIPTTYDQRNRAVLTSLFGLDGGEPLTLEEVSRQQPQPTSRERIRQIGLPFLRALQAQGESMPWLRRAMTLLQEAAPCGQQQAEARLRTSGIVSSPLSVIAVLKLLDRAGLQHDLLVEEGQLLPGQSVKLRQSIERKAYRDCARWGVADWKELSAPLGDSTATARSLLREVTWLDDSERYFTFPGRKNSLANRLSRVLHVSPRVCLSAAYSALFRDPRVDQERLPRELFPVFCRVWPWCRVEGNHIMAQGKLPPVYHSSDDQLVRIILRFGRPVTREEIRESAVREGISDATLNQSLKHSNVLASVNGRYVVIGNGCCEYC